MIEKNEIIHTSKVARLNLTNDEVETFQKELSGVISWFDELSKVDTKGVSPSFHPFEIKDVVRDDKEGECLSEEEVFSNTPHKKEGFFTGPKSV